MKVIKAMEYDDFVSICGAAVEAFWRTIDIADRRGIDRSHLVSMLSVMLAGIIKANGLTVEDITATVETAARLWRIDEPGNVSKNVFILPLTDEVRPEGN